MKKLLILFVGLLSFASAFSQSQNIEANKIKAKVSLAPPFSDTTNPAFYIGEVRTRPQDTLLYRYNGRVLGKKWDLVGLVGSDTTFYKTPGTTGIRVAWVSPNGDTLNFTKVFAGAGMTITPNADSSVLTFIAASGVNIYNSNGILTGHRQLSGGGFALSLGLNSSKLLSFAVFVDGAAGGTYQINGPPQYPEAGSADANYTITGNNAIIQLGAITANRNLVLPAPNASGMQFVFIDSNAVASSFAWQFTGATVRKPDGTAVTAAPNNSYFTLTAQTGYWAISTTNSVDAAGGGGVPVTDVQVFTSSATWTKPTGAKFVYVKVIGAGGGGGAGRKGALTTVRGGGGGAGSGGISEKLFVASSLGATATITVGTGGSGGASATTNDTDGGNGVSGTNSSFGTDLIANGAVKGLGGSTVGGTGGAAGTGKDGNGQVGGTGGGNGTGSNGLSTVYGPTPGGGGEGIGTDDATHGRGFGGSFSSLWTNPLNNYNAGFGSGANGSTMGATDMGSGGNGGAASTSTNGTAGGNGGNYGAGGGGGGAAVNSVGNSGAGGAGAGGLVVVITIF